MSIEIGDYVEVAKENPYTSTVEALIAAGDNKQARITVDSKDEKKTRFRFSKAANDKGKTARLRNTEISEDGSTVTLTFTLTDRHKARRHKGDTATNGEAIDETPAKATKAPKPE